MAKARALPPKLAVLDDETRAVCAAWFGMMLPDHGELFFAMKEQRPSPRAQAALDRLLEAGVVRSKPRDGGVSYVPVVDCSPLMGWFATQVGNKAFAFPLTERIQGEGSAGFRMEVEGSPEALKAAAMAAEEVEGEVASRKR